jgi:hypothetical protein
MLLVVLLTACQVGRADTARVLAMPVAQGNA